jgi:hypothetical protein
MNSNYERVLPGQVGQVLGNGGAAGDYLDRIIITVTDATTSAVSIKDGGGSAISILPNSPGAGVGRYVVPIGASSRAGPWRATAGLGASVVAVGSFSRKNTAEYLSLPGTAGNYASTPDAAPLDITGDIDIRLRVNCTDWSPATAFDFVDKLTNDTTQFSYMLRLNTSGTLQLYWSADGVTPLSATSSVAAGPPDGTTKWVRATLDVDNGAAGRDVKFYLSDDGAAWTQLGTTQTSAGVTSIFAGTAALHLGGDRSGVSGMLSGRVYYSEIRNGIDGTVVAKFDPREGVVAATSFTSGSGEVWTVNQSGTPAAELV